LNTQTENVSVQPSLQTLRGELSYILRNESFDETWFRNLIEPQRHSERVQQVPTKTGQAWVWPYGNRVKHLLRDYLRADTKLQDVIKAAREDKIYWRGDTLDFFMTVIDETEKMRKVGVAAYRSRTMQIMKAAIKA